MGDALRQRLRQSKFESPAQEALLSLLLAAARVRERLDRSSEGHGITRSQYNVLRILRGAHPQGYARCEIAPRLIERAPDLTRLVDRLQERGLVERLRSSEDRRQSVARITRKGLDLLEEMRPAIEGVHRELAARLSKRESQQLARLCEKLYAEP